MLGSDVLVDDSGSGTPPTQPPAAAAASAHGLALAGAEPFVARSGHGDIVSWRQRGPPREAVHHDRPLALAGLSSTGTSTSRTTPPSSLGLCEVDRMGPIRRTLTDLSAEIAALHQNVEIAANEHRQQLVGAIEDILAPVRAERETMLRSAAELAASESRLAALRRDEERRVLVAAVARGQTMKELEALRNQSTIRYHGEWAERYGQHLIDTRAYFGKQAAAHVPTEVDADQALQAVADAWWKQRRTFASLFKSLDADGDHRISPQELEQALAKLQLRISPEQLRLATAALDRNHDGTISRSEVVQMILSRKPQEVPPVSLSTSAQWRVPFQPRCVALCASYSICLHSVCAGGGVGASEPIVTVTKEDGGFVELCSGPRGCRKRHGHPWQPGGQRTGR